MGTKIKNLYGNSLNVPLQCITYGFYLFRIPHQCLKLVQDMNKF